MDALWMVSCACVGFSVCRTRFTVSFLFIIDVNKVMMDKCFSNHIFLCLKRILIFKFYMIFFQQVSSTIVSLLVGQFVVWLVTWLVGWSVHFRSCWIDCKEIFCPHSSSTDGEL